MNMFADGNSWLAAQLKAAGSSSVTYTRGNYVATILATIGRHRPLSVGESDDNQVDTFATVFTFDAADLVLNGVATVPARGDRVTYSANGVAFTLEVIPIEGERWWRDVDAFGKRLEVQAKVIGRV